MLKFNDKLLFVEVPRTGTTTIRDCISWYEIMNGFRHASIKDYLQLNPQDIGLDVVSIVRNPYDRFVSLYEHTKHFNKEKSQVKSFESFVDWFINDDGMVMTIDNIRQTQFNMLSIDDKIMAKWVGRFERYSKDLYEMLKDNGLPVPLFVLPTTNKFKEIEYSPYYNETTKAMIGKYFEQDLDYFKYTF